MTEIIGLIFAFAKIKKMQKDSKTPDDPLWKCLELILIAYMALAVIEKAKEVLL